jgi:hypothetical protein
MMRDITHEQTRVQISDTYTGQILNSVNRNFGRCFEVVKTAPPRSVKRSESIVTLSVPALALSAAMLPAVLPVPATRLMCASILALVLIVFVGRRLAIVQSMSADQTYKLTGALMGTFLFGLVVALLLSECLGLIAH